MQNTVRTRITWAAPVLAAVVALVAAACVPPTPSGPTTTTTVPPDTTESVSDATLEWTVSREADNGSFAPGQVNYWSAGESDSTESTYVATDGDVTVLKQNAVGTYVPIGSEAAVNWANRNKRGDGTTVTAFNDVYLEQLVRLANGTGTVDTATGEAEISWDGTFTINFYGTYVPFWITDPTLTVEADGSGRITATMGGFASDISDPDTRTPLPDTPGVVVAEFDDVYASGSAGSGFTADTQYVGNAVTGIPGAPQVPLTPGNASFWGAWPQSFIDFQADTGLGSYWYSSGGAADSKKPQDPVSATWTLDP